MKQSEYSIDKIMTKLENGIELSAAEQSEFVKHNKEMGMADSGNLRSMEALGRVLGVSRQLIGRWKKQGMPIEDDGTYDPDKVKQWAGIGDAKSTSRSEVLEKSIWDTRYRRAKALQEEMKLKKDASLLIERIAVEELLVDRAIEFRKALIGLARRVSLRGELKPAQELYGIIEDAVLNILETYSRENVVIGDPVVVQAKEQKPK